MRKDSDEGSLDHNKRRVIMIQHSQPLETTDHSNPTKRPFPYGQNFKQNTDINSVPPESNSIGQKHGVGLLETPRTSGFKPAAEVMPFHLDIIFSSLSQLRQEVSSLVGRLEVMENRITRMDQREDSDTHHALKKKRRRAEEILKTYLCGHPSCQKAYGSQMSLNLHMKLKHPQKEEGYPGSEERLNGVSAGTPSESEQRQPDLKQGENQMSMTDYK